MTNLFASIRGYLAGVLRAWDRFWFAPSDPATLCAVRIATGLLLLWTHGVWSIALADFFGPDGWLPLDVQGAQNRGRLAFSIFTLMGSGVLLWFVHAVNLVVFAMLTVGFWSRFAAVWSFVAAVQYALRVTPGAFFGLDKINCLLAMYVMLGPCGARWSIDAWRRRRAAGGEVDVPASSMATFALRLLQLHLCVVYLFSGLGKLQGVRWWDGTATWFAVANVEYRSLDMTWLAGHLWLVDLLTHATVFWELFYIAIVWPAALRPWVLLGAVGVHGFIGLGMGMPEFALAMLVANAAFLAPETVRALVGRVAWKGRGAAAPG